MEPTGVEPVTSGLQSQRSSQLSYGPYSMRVPRAGVEPARPKRATPPQDAASANSATWARLCSKTTSTLIKFPCVLCFIQTTEDTEFNTGNTEKFSSKNKTPCNSSLTLCNPVSYILLRPRRTPSSAQKRRSFWDNTGII